MKSRSALLALAVVLAAALSPATASNTPVFYLDTDETTYTTIFRADTASGQLTPVGSVPFDAGLALGMAADDANTLYVVTQPGQLLRITVAPFMIESLGTVGSNAIVGLEFADGILYAADEASNLLSAIDPQTLAVTPIGSVHHPDGSQLTVAGGDLARDTNGTVYLWSNATEALYLLDVTTAIATPVPAQQGSLGLRNGLAFDHAAGEVLLASSGPLDAFLVLDPNSGAAVGAVPMCVSCPTPYDARFGDLATPPSPCTDADGDGFAREGGSCGAQDCDDASAAINPGATDVCNGVDDDCDGTIDNAASARTSCLGPCVADALCVNGSCVVTPVTCTRLDQCHRAGTCDPATGECTNPPKRDFSPCRDGNPCTLFDTCRAGTCVAGRPRVCSFFKFFVGTCRPTDGACCGRLGGRLGRRVPAEICFWPWPRHEGGPRGESGLRPRLEHKIERRLGRAARASEARLP